MAANVSDAASRDGAVPVCWRERVSVSGTDWNLIKALRMDTSITISNAAQTGPFQQNVSLKVEVCPQGQAPLQAKTPREVLPARRFAQRCEAISSQPGG
jgi:hypothetical protein